MVIYTFDFLCGRKGEPHVGVKMTVQKRKPMMAGGFNGIAPRARCTSNPLVVPSNAAMSLDAAAIIKGSDAHPKPEEFTFTYGTAGFRTE
jgi:hypothetical protein